ncbi:MAG: hypothetical protein ACR2JC_04725 [Chloroflexota bacterium]
MEAPPLFDRRDWKRTRKRAKKLLYSHLGKKQRGDLKRKGRFDVFSSRGNVYRISNVFPFNVRLAGYAKRSRVFFCLEAEDPDVPREDVMLAQKTMLESDEGEFLRLANMTYIPK